MKTAIIRIFGKEFEVEYDAGREQEVLLPPAYISLPNGTDLKVEWTMATGAPEASRIYRLRPPIPPAGRAGSFDFVKAVER